MSIHARLSTEAQARLRRQKRNSTVSSIVISVLSVVLIFVILGLFLLPIIIKDNPTIVTYSASLIEEKEAVAKKVSSQVQRKPSAPSSAMSKVITSNLVSAVAVPVPDVEVTTPSVDFGDGEDFGSGWGDGDFGAGGGGGGGGFGSDSASSGGLQGYFYAIEHNRRSTKAKPVVKPVSDPEFWKILSRMQSSGFPESMLDDYYRSEKSLYLTNLAIPNTVSQDGPKLFGADHVQGRYWLAHYRGVVTVPKSGTYRFSGVGDNYLHLLIDGKPVMHYGGAAPAGWEREATDSQTKHQSPYTRGWWVNYGKWISLSAGQKIMVDIGIAEGGGGWCGFLLQVEEKGTKYGKAPNGRPILPLFTTAPFSGEEIKTLRDTLGPYELDFDKVLVFPVRR